MGDGRSRQEGAQPQRALGVAMPHIVGCDVLDVLAELLQDAGGVNKGCAADLPPLADAVQGKMHNKVLVNLSVKQPVPPGYPNPKIKLATKPVRSRNKEG